MRNSEDWLQNALNVKIIKDSEKTIAAHEKMSIESKLKM